MKNLTIIFGIIKRYCREKEISNEQCFSALEKLNVNESIFFPLFSYLRVLQSLGLIKLSRFRKVIVLTEKGKAANDVPYSAGALFLVLLHILRRLVIVTFFFALFWPMLLAMQKQYDAEKNGEGNQAHG
jgi:hypothetical protein